VLPGPIWAVEPFPLPQFKQFDFHDSQYQGTRYLSGVPAQWNILELIGPTSSNRHDFKLISIVPVEAPPDVPVQEPGTPPPDIHPEGEQCDFVGSGKKQAMPLATIFDGIANFHTGISSA
jgi:hypothetical protein